MFARLPLPGLRVFEAVARLSSFKRAAAELAVTPTAVSHQIRALERQLGFALFDRLPRGARLTARGAQLFHTVHGALLELAQTLDRLRPAPAEGSLTVTTTPSFAALWLVPRLGRFYDAHPGLHLLLDTRPEVLDLLQDASLDLAIRYGQGPYPGLYQAAELRERFSVYGAPALLARPVAGLPTLISVHWRDSTLYAQAWEAWCQAAGLPWQAAPRRLYEEENHALQAAVAGQGLVLASSLMVADSVAHGLLRPLRPEVSVPGAAYAVLCAPGRERHPPVAAFLDWMARQ